MGNKTVTIELVTGKKVGLTLTFGLLYILREKQKESFEKYNNIVMGGIKDMLDYPTALYVAYLCKCEEENTEPEFTESEFRNMLPFDMSEVVDVYADLYNAGKKLLSGTHSKAEQER